MEKEKDDSIHNKLKDLGFELPKQLQIPFSIKTPPTWIRIRGDKAYVSGHGPQNPDGSIAGPFGKVVSTSAASAATSSTNSWPKELSIEQGYQSAKLAGLSILGSLKRELGSLDRVTAWLQTRVMINTVSGFTQTTYVADGFSDLVIKLYGPERGLHARSAIGVQALPMDLPVIIDALVEIEKDAIDRWDQIQKYSNKLLDDPFIDKLEDEDNTKLLHFV